jgi:hypothetical protein
MLNLLQLKNIYFTLSDIFSRQLNNPQQQGVIQNNVSKSKSNIISGIENLTKNIVTGSVQDPNLQNRRAINKNELINYDLFLESLAITANIMKNSSDYKSSEKVINILSKVLYLLERISHSEASKKCLMKSGKTL